MNLSTKENFHINMQLIEKTTILSICFGRTPLSKTRQSNCLNLSSLSLYVYIYAGHLDIVIQIYQFQNLIMLPTCILFESNSKNHLDIYNNMLSINFNHIYLWVKVFQTIEIIHIKKLVNHAFKLNLKCSMNLLEMKSYNFSYLFIDTNIIRLSKQPIGAKCFWCSNINILLQISNKNTRIHFYWAYTGTSKKT